MSIENNVIQQIDLQRTRYGFLGISQLLELSTNGNVIFDPFSTLISASVVLGNDNIFYPNVIAQAKDDGELSIGTGNVFYANTLVLAEKGKISIGNNNQFGDGGCALKANTAEAEISVGDNGRYINGAQVIGRTTLGSGSQILGPITAQDCTLEGGGDYRSADPDLRAGLLKGSGLARGITVPMGRVLNGMGAFLQEAIEEQSKYHPKK